MAIGIEKMVKTIKTRFEGKYVTEDAHGREYIYNEKTGDIHEASNLELDWLKPRSKYAIRDQEIDSWRAW